MARGSELLARLQPGTTMPVLVVLLDVPGGAYCRRWRKSVIKQPPTDGLRGREDLRLGSLTSWSAAVMDPSNQVCPRSATTGLRHFAWHANSTAALLVDFTSQLLH